ncbi:MAG: transcriptional regulator GcvA [Xanthomonadales bacterium]|jgi:LysR family glycine cleavage system transcriptional activator|nr:transcriptional regulator GcvA [Xanthomonadales bacterium]
MRKNAIPLNALRAFEAAARNKSFKKAADELFVSHSAISHQVRRLEEYLSVDLFHRVSRGVELTRAGRTYYPSLRDAFRLIEEGTDLVLAPRNEGPLTLQVYSTFAVRWLIPRLTAFNHAHPDVLVRLHTSQSDVNFEHEDVDLCVMVGVADAAGVHYDFLFNSELFPVCSPEFMAQQRLSAPQDLAGLNLIQVYPSGRDWYHWIDRFGVENVDPQQGLQVDSYDLAFNTASQGLGVALGMRPFVDRELRSGALVEAFPDHRVTAPGAWYLACREEQREDDRVVAFRSWLLEAVKNS